MALQPLPAYLVPPLVTPYRFLEKPASALTSPSRIRSRNMIGKKSLASLLQFRFRVEIFLIRSSARPTRPCLATADRPSIPNVTITTFSPAKRPLSASATARWGCHLSKAYRGEISDLTPPPRISQPVSSPDQQPVQQALITLARLVPNSTLPFAQATVLAICSLFYLDCFGSQGPFTVLQSTLLSYQHLNLNLLIELPTNEKPPMVRHSCAQIFHAPIPYA